MSRTTHEPRWDEILAALPLSPPLECPYFADRQSVFREFRANRDIPAGLLALTLERGYRRCGDIYYQPQCPTCALCHGYRLPVDKFTPSRAQRRVLARNLEVTWELARPVQTKEKEDIYLRYQRQQHFDRPAGVDTPRPYDPAMLLRIMSFQMYKNPASTREAELRLNGQLIGFGTYDLTADNLSAVYFVFDPDFRDRSLGVLNILRAVAWCQGHRRKWLHLGYQIPGHPKMDYKRTYGPAEVLGRDYQKWRLVARGVGGDPLAGPPGVPTPTVEPSREQ